MSELSAVRIDRVETIATAVLTVSTPDEGFVEITGDVAQFVEQIGARDGVVLLYLKHTSASLVI